MTLKSWHFVNIFLAGAVRLAQRQIWTVMADRSHGPGRIANDPDPRKSNRVMEAMLKMKKIDLRL